MKPPGPTAARALARSGQSYAAGAEAIAYGPRRSPRAAWPAGPRLAPATTQAGKTITKEGLKKNDYLYVEAATGGISPPPPGTASTMNVRILLPADVDYKTTRVPLEGALRTPRRNDVSDSPIHQNLQGRLPTYAAPQTGVQPYLEYFGGIGASRFVVDVAANRVYLSYHYGDDSAKTGTVPKWAKKKDVSPFVQMGGGWPLAAILQDAGVWWGTLGLGAAGT